jgi:MoaA/NifB/PqqE/SkfB family radical SAM enzyme
MCYFHPDIKTGQPAAPRDAFVRAIAEAQSQLGLRNLVFTGKEPFLNPHLLLDLLRSSFDLNVGHPDLQFQVGVITNGRHFSRIWNQLEDLSALGALNYLDISIDSGFAAQHDAIRGKEGAFATAVISARESAARLPKTRVSINSVLMPDNQVGLLELIREMHRDVGHYFIAPVQPPPFALSPFVGSADIVGLCRSLRHLLAGELAEANIEVTVLVQGLYVHVLADADLLNLENLYENDQGMCSLGEEIASNHLLYQMTILPEYGHRLARILHTGDYLAHAHYVETPHPEKHSVGNIQEEPLSTLYARGKEADSLFARLAAARTRHDCRSRECWSNCFGGWSVAEQSLLYGQSETERPHLCVSPGELLPESALTTPFDGCHHELPLTQGGRI